MMVVLQTLSDNRLMLAADETNNKNKALSLIPCQSQVMKEALVYASLFMGLIALHITMRRMVP